MAQQPTSPSSTAGVNLKLAGVSYSTWGGAFIGTTLAQATFVIHPDGSIVGAPIREEFTGTIHGFGTGTLTFAEEAHAQPDRSTEIAATILAGSGDLANVRGRLIFVGTCDLYGACTGTYSGELHRQRLLTNDQRARHVTVSARRDCERKGVADYAPPQVNGSVPVRGIAPQAHLLRPALHALCRLRWPRTADRV
jgi:hypothetical protein